jgi:putative tryptophan/tyrosine transport system substrate-binding protein
MRRRDFIAGLGGAAAWPLSARAQRPKMPVIGYIGIFSNSADAFRKGLRETGYIEGQNVSIEYRWTQGRNDPLSALPLVKDLVDRGVSVIAAETLPLAVAAKDVTKTIPIVFRAGTDPVAAGLVASLNRPGANVTGISTFSQDLGPKRLELLREFLSPGDTVAVLVNQTNVVAIAEAKEVEAAAPLLRLRLRVVTMNSDSLRELDAAFESIAQMDVSGLLIINAPSFFVWRDHLAALAARRPLPAIFADRIFAEAGGLMSYGTDGPDGFRLAGVYVGRILKGEKPADLPVQLSTRVELVINMKTAKAFGLTFPLNLLGRADAVIE